MTEKPLVGISTCLLGEKVRYDGGHKLDHYLHDTLGMYVEYVPVCPEVECGMSIPREAVHLEEQNGMISLITQRSKKNLTHQMQSWISRKYPDLSSLPLCGYIFKSKSPSCGLNKVKIYRNETVACFGRGMYAQTIVESNPLLPVEDEGRLHDADLRENFIERIFIMYRWHHLSEIEKSLSNLMTFHAHHKYTLMAHCPKTLKELGALIAHATRKKIADVYDAYFEQCITALGKIATVKKNSNVLLHIAGYFKNNLSSVEKIELQEIIENYHSQLVPLIVPVTLINHYVRKYKPEYLEHQYYLHPHPLELMLRNHV